MTALHFTGLLAGAVALSIRQNGLINPDCKTDKYDMERFGRMRGNVFTLGQVWFLILLCYKNPLPIFVDSVSSIIRQRARAMRAVGGGYNHNISQGRFHSGQEKMFWGAPAPWSSACPNLSAASPIASKPSRPTTAKSPAVTSAGC